MKFPKFLRKKATVDRDLAAEKLAWWGVFTECLRMAIDDADQLHRARQADYAERLVEGAANIASAAVDKYFQHFRGVE